MAGRPDAPAPPVTYVGARALAMLSAYRAQMRQNWESVGLGALGEGS
jgi:hypothetical protein